MQIGRFSTSVRKRASDSVSACSAARRFDASIAIAADADDLLAVAQRLDVDVEHASAASTASGASTRPRARACAPGTTSAPWSRPPARIASRPLPTTSSRVADAEQRQRGARRRRHLEVGRRRPDERRRQLFQQQLDVSRGAAASDHRATIGNASDGLGSVAAVGEAARDRSRAPSLTATSGSSVT